MDGWGGGKGGLLKQRECMQRHRCARAGNLMSQQCGWRTGLWGAVVGEGSRRCLPKDLDSAPRQWGSLKDFE